MKFAEIGEVLLLVRQQLCEASPWAKFDPAPLERPERDCYRTQMPFDFLELRRARAVMGQFGEQVAELFSGHGFLQKEPPVGNVGDRSGGAPRAFASIRGLPGGVQQAITLGPTIVPVELCKDL